MRSLWRTVFFFDVSLRFGIVTLLLPFCSVETLTRILRRRPFWQYANLTSHEMRRAQVWCVKYSSKMRQPPCLRSSLVLHSLLTQSQLLIGVRRRDLQLESHAWVETPSETHSTVDPSQLTPIWQDRREVGRDR